MAYTAEQLRKDFLNFFKGKQHSILPSASLIPENDPTVLFTTAGMHPLVPFLLGQKHPSGKRLANVQICIRTGDIDEVGDAIHHTFFEMLGNWSLGDYFKKESLTWTYEFLTKVLKIDHSLLAVTCFEGDSDVPQDTESAKIWHSLGITNLVFLGRKNNWWGPAGETGPCGPDSEIFYYTGKGKPKGSPKTHPQEWVEIWNNVFIEYEKKKDGSFAPLKQKNVDTGMGLERTLAVLNGFTDNYTTELFWPLIQSLEQVSGKKYGDEKEVSRSMRIIVDHMKAATFIVGDEKGVLPSNLGQGYVLRRLIRRAIRHARLLGLEKDFCRVLSDLVVDIYAENYPSLEKKRDLIGMVLAAEEEKFQKQLEKGLKEFEKIASHSKKEVSGHDAFVLFTTHGFPLEMIKELAEEKRLKVDVKSYLKEFEKHQEQSRTARAGIFKSGLADASEETIKLHTTSHILLKVLRETLGDNVVQKGSNITPERLRFDFNLERKLTVEELKEIEDRVNEIIQMNLNVKRHEGNLEEAKKAKALGIFEHKYTGKVSWYEIEGFSHEICTGPHVVKTGVLGTFRIIKEESSSAGVRRIKAVLEKK